MLYSYNPAAAPLGNAQQWLMDSLDLFLSNWFYRCYGNEWQARWERVWTQRQAPTKGERDLVAYLSLWLDLWPQGLR